MIDISLNKILIDNMYNQICHLMDNKDNNDNKMIVDDDNEDKKDQPEKIVVRNLCEYFSRFQNTKSMEHGMSQDPEYFNTYIRSNHHRARKQINYKNKDITIKDDFIKMFNIEKNQQYQKRMIDSIDKQLSNVQARSQQLEKEINRVNELNVVGKQKKKQQLKLIKQINSELKLNLKKLPSINQFKQQILKRKVKLTKIKQNLEKMDIKDQIKSEMANHLGLVKPLNYKINENVKVIEDIQQSSLYDEYIQFLYSRCQIILNKLQSTNKLSVYIWSSYPCLLIYPKFQKIKCEYKEKDTFDNKIKYLCQLFMYMFVAKCVLLAKQKGFSIQVVLRSSFGHLLPSVAQINECFRFSPGVVPSQYLLQVVVPALEQTSQQINALLIKQISSKTTFSQQMDRLRKSNNLQVQKTWNLSLQQFKKFKENLKAVENKQNFIQFQNNYGELIISKASSGKTGKCLLAQFFRETYYGDYFVNCILQRERYKSSIAECTVSTINHFIRLFDGAVKKQILKITPIQSNIPKTKDQEFLNKKRANPSQNKVIQQKKKSKQQNQPQQQKKEKKEKKIKFSIDPKQIKLKFKNFVKYQLSKNVQIKDSGYKIMVGKILFALSIKKEKESLQVIQNSKNSTPFYFYQTAQSLMRIFFQKQDQKINKEMKFTQEMRNKQNMSSNQSFDHISHRKIIVSNGMAAITLSILASGLLINQQNNDNIQITKPFENQQQKNLPSTIQKELTMTKEVQVNYSGSYYQTAEFFKFFQIFKEAKQDQFEILLYDLNSISAQLPQSQQSQQHKKLKNQDKQEQKISKEKEKKAKQQLKLKLSSVLENQSKVKVIIFDVTSSTSTQISHALQICAQLTDPQLFTIITVSSGLKLSQLGLDLAQWGQIRIWDIKKNNERKVKNNQIMRDLIYKILQLDEFNNCLIPESIDYLRKIFKKFKATASSKIVMQLFEKQTKEFYDNPSSK